ncbi:hypothetical protein [Sphingobacterium sp. BN32]|uniref:hypothetical protein n=1 Tax=Sphingobacterium sp. BN32 TaxID=3058432 RepID=UPI00265CB7AE|nr:hypothetical protein [Sphingobacterium sp. BN32]WKK57356.1 hypothetical protein QYC40_11965 [Sphingobacterium sp. BN32]
MKRLLITFSMFLFVFVSSGQVVLQENSKKNDIQKAIKTWKSLEKTTAFDLSPQRIDLLKTIEQYSDSFPPEEFKAYLEMSEEDAMAMERKVPILYAYRKSFDKVLNEVKNNRVKNGTAQVWLLYNMGFIVKTPSACFGIDVDHRLASQFAPYLDFLYITHNHGDHANVKLMEAMTKLGKPVISNFYKPGSAYHSLVPTSYQIGNITIRTDMDDHLANPKFPKFISMARIDCGADAGSFSLLHCGDAGFTPANFTKIQGPVNLLVMRWGEPRENNLLGTGEGQVQPEYAVLTHLIELRHKPYPHGQASITKTMEHLPAVKCDKTMIPFWGERLTWKDGMLK